MRAPIVVAVPLFSVILPTHGRPRFLAEAISSVLDQTVQDFELIVVDDASPDPVEVPCDPRIRTVRRSVNGGPAAAHNKRIAAATAEFVTFIDDDDLFDRRRLEMALTALERAPVGLCWFRHLGSEPAGRVLEGVIGGDLLRQTVPHLGATAVRRTAVLPFDERYLGSQDVEWWIRMSHLPVATTPEVGYWIRRHDGVRNRNGPLARIEGSRRMLEEHADFFRRHPAAAAFRWKRIGLMHAELSERGPALRAYGRSMRIRPAVSTGVQMVRALRG